uniref:Uncharacterized protein n=1 Tax=Rhizophora mucronata TaxID=61149 RepID=A0A2P2PWD3_RHIMU
MYSFVRFIIPLWSAFVVVWLARLQFQIIYGSNR